MTREEKEKLIRHLKYNLEIGADYLITDKDAVEIIKALEQDWIPVKYHEATEEEIEEEGYPFDVCFIFDNPMPDDEQEILITTEYKNKRTGQAIYRVEKDVCYCDDGYSLDSGYSWLTDVVAWREMPEPYKAESEVKNDA